MIRKLLLPIIAAVMLVSCSDIGEDERFIPIESVTPRRGVLLEEFTGQNCVNCPAAHKEIEALAAQYPDAFIPVSIHAGDFGISSTARRPGLMQPEGNVFNDRYGITEWPKGVINGTGGALNYNEWSDRVRVEIERDAAVAVELSAVADIAAGTIKILCEFKPNSDLSGSVNVWLTEDAIVARQLDKEAGLISDYVHNHVFRAAVTGVDGENIALDAGIHKTLEYITELRNTDKEKWVPRNLSVVVFIRDADGAVLQAARTKVEVDDGVE